MLRRCLTELGDTQGVQVALDAENHRVAVGLLSVALISLVPHCLRHDRHWRATGETSLRTSYIRLIGRRQSLNKSWGYRPVPVQLMGGGTIMGPPTFKTISACWVSGINAGSPRHLWPFTVAVISPEKEPSRSAVNVTRQMSITCPSVKSRASGDSM